MALPLAIPAIAAGISALQNASSQDRAHDAISKAIGTLQGTEGYADSMRNEGMQVLQQMLGANQSIYGTPEQAALALQQAQQGINAVNPYEAGEFSYDKTLDDFYDKALGLRMDAANDAINQSQALGGNLFSSDTANKLVAQAQVLGSQAYNDALNAFQTDKSLEQGIWQGNEAARQAAANSQANIANMQYGVASDTAGNIANAQNDYYSALIGLNDDYWQNKTDYAMQIAQMQAQDPGGRSMVSKILDPFGIF